MSRIDGSGREGVGPVVEQGAASLLNLSGDSLSVSVLIVGFRRRRRHAHRVAQALIPKGRAPRVRCRLPALGALSEGNFHGSNPWPDPSHISFLRVQSEFLYKVIVRTSPEDYFPENDFEHDVHPPNIGGCF
jgi:hypothetical protein